jgi:hypothetical protein
MTHTKIKIIQLLLLGALFQIAATSCTYNQLPGLASTITYGSQLAPKDSEYNEDEVYPMIEDPYSN